MSLTDGHVADANAHRLTKTQYAEPDRAQAWGRDIVDVGEGERHDCRCARTADQLRGTG